MRQAPVSGSGSTVSELTHVINEIAAPLTGGDYFRTLVSRLCVYLEVSTAIVTECLDYPEHHVRTLAYWAGGKFGEDFEFAVKGTPCEGQELGHPRIPRRSERRGHRLGSVSR